MLVHAAITLPRTEGIKRKAECMIRFLKESLSDSIQEPEECRLEWECPLSKEMVGFCVQRHRVESRIKYRMEYHKVYHMEYTLELLAPTVPSLPSFLHAIIPEDLRTLLSMLEVELSTKWPSSSPSS